MIHGIAENQTQLSDYTYIWLVKISILGVIKTRWNASEAAGAKEGWSNSTLQLQMKKAILSQFDTYN